MTIRRSGAVRLSAAAGSPVRLTLTGRPRPARTTVHEPSSGFVTLRSTVTDGRGDSTVQTIDKAYGIG